MSVLFHDIIYGPVKSRRFGYSLGINLLPTNSKICTFNCIYCECGWNPDKTVNNFADKNEIFTYLEEVLTTIKETNSPLDVITFAGNGEPTLHPDFEEIVSIVLSLRNKLAENKPIVLLTNGTTLHQPKIQNAIKNIDIPVFKIDSAVEETRNLINKPFKNYDFEAYIKNLKLLNQTKVIQTMFLKGHIGNIYIDNTTEKELNALIKIYKTINPSYVMLYSLDRKPPLSTLQKVEHSEMQSIARKIENNGIITKWV
jgi:wyosine [tRNA(Phe)-imidazoG37] synthetase (radical SAM superfamily)